MAVDPEARRSSRAGDLGGQQGVQEHAAAEDHRVQARSVAAAAAQTAAMISTSVEWNRRRDQRRRVAPRRTSAATAAIERAGVDQERCAARDLTDSSSSNG